MINKLELTWVGKYENEEIEPRILIENNEKSYGDKDTGNMLIHGDNLLALKALEQKMGGKIKCIYIDPPYNTGSAFENYDDNVEHSLWLSLMKDRLELLKKLLSEQGVIFIQIDDGEQAYLKILCDEIFGRNNFVNCIAIKMSPSSGVKRRFANIKFIKNKEYILVYKKESLEIKPIFDKIEEYDVNYTIFYDGKELTSLAEKIKLIDLKYAEVSTKDYLKFPEIKKYIMKNKNNIYRRHGHSKWVIGNINDNNLEYKKCEKMVSRSHIWRVNNPNNLEEYELIMNTGSENKVGYERLEPLSWKVIDDELTLLRGDFWDGYESDMGNVSKEGIINTKVFGEGQKPERLIRDILYATTEEGDYVLDSFLGSGTTCAVAHKMKRKWIGIELGEQCYTHCKIRIDNVIKGEKTGISNSVNWKGGGGYRFYELAPTLIKTDSFGQSIINKEYNADMLAAAVALHEGFRYNPSKEKFWKQSEGNEKSYLYVTTKFLNKEDIENIKTDMEDNEFLIIACTAYDKSIEGLYKNIRIKKIPEMLLSKCEFGKDNYNLNIINPPEYEEEIEDDE